MNLAFKRQFFAFWYFAKIINGFKLFIIFAEKLHRICATGFKKRLWQVIVGKVNG